MNSAEGKIIIYRHAAGSSYWYRAKTADYQGGSIDNAVAANLERAIPGEIVLAQWEHQGKPGSILMFQIGVVVARITEIPTIKREEQTDG